MAERERRVFPLPFVALPMQNRVLQECATGSGEDGSRSLRLGRGREMILRRRVRDGEKGQVEAIREALVGSPVK